MIEIVRAGHIFASNCEALVNPVNCVGVMGAGLALQFKERYPENFRRYKSACDRGVLRPGRVLTTFRDNLNPRLIINVATKKHWRDKSALEVVAQGIREISSACVNSRVKSIAIPAIGCGLGGLWWEDMRPIAESEFESLPDIRVLLYPPR